MSPLMRFARWPVSHSEELGLAPRLRIIRTALLPERRETSITNAVVLQREYCDYIPQRPPVLLGPAAAKNAFVLRDRLHWSQLLH